MDTLVDSKIIQDLLKNENENYETIIEYFPGVNFNLLKTYYDGGSIKNEDLLKLAEDMNLLNCGQLTEVLIKIKLTFSKVDYTSINPDLIREIYELDKFVKIASGHHHSVGLKRDGTIVTFIVGNFYQEKNSPTGGLHSVALKRNGKIVIWGDYSKDQREGTPSDNGYIAIACGSYHSVALHQNGSIITWGDDLYRQFLDSPLGNGFISIACGNDHSVALSENGTITIWGDYSHQQRDNVPTQDAYISISCGNYSSAALSKDGKVVIWGQKKS